MEYFLDGRLVVRVDRVGIPLDVQGIPYTGVFPSLGPGLLLVDQLDSVTLAHGLVAVVDAFPFHHHESPELSVSIPRHGLDTLPGEDLVLVVADLHALLSTPAEAILERLVEYAAPSIRLLLASRAAPGFGLSRLLVGGALFEIPPDELRFRYREVEELFRAFYDEPIPPEDLAELTGRTEGGPAGCSCSTSPPEGSRWRNGAGWSPSSATGRAWPGSTCPAT